MFGLQVAVSSQSMEAGGEVKQETKVKNECPTFTQATCFGSYYDI